MSIDDGDLMYDDDDRSGRPGEGRRALLWFAGVTIALASLTAGVLIGNARSASNKRDTPVVAASLGVDESSAAGDPSLPASAPGDGTSSGDASAGTSTDSGASPSTSPSGSGSAPVSASPSTSAASPSVTPGPVLAAATPAGDIVLVDSETAAITQTLIKSADLSTGEGAAGDPVSVSWHAGSGTVYVARGCAVLRHRVADGKTERIAGGRLAAVSPDGTKVAVWTCRAGSVGDLAVIDASTGKVAQSLPLTTASADQGGNMNYISSIDWRSDGGALVVTVGWEGDDVQHVIDLRKLAKSVVVAARLPLGGVVGSYHTAEYVGQRLVLYGTCCAPDEGTSFVVVRDGKTGALTKIPALAGIGFIDPTSDGNGHLRYLKRTQAGGAGALWALDSLTGTPRELGGEFTQIDW